MITNYSFTDSKLKIISEDSKLQTLHLIDNAVYERKGALTFIKLRLNIQGSYNEYTTQPILRKPSRPIETNHPDHPRPTNYDETKRVQGWSRQNLLRGILIIVSLYIQS